MGGANTKQPNLFTVILTLADDEKQLESAFNKYFEFAKSLRETLPKDTPESELESKLTEIFANQIDVFELCRAILYTIDKTHRFRILDEELGPKLLSDNEIGAKTKQFVAKRLTEQIFNHMTRLTYKSV
jgi:hypothetical protein